MPNRMLLPLLALIFAVLAPGWAMAQPPMRPPAVPRLFMGSPLPMQDPWLQCRQAIRAAERAAGMPDQLMAAIGHVESGRPDSNGVVHPWPWTINAEGQGQMFDSKADAIAAAQQALDLATQQDNQDIAARARQMLAAWRQNSPSPPKD